MGEKSNTDKFQEVSIMLEDIAVRIFRMKKVWAGRQKENCVYGALTRAGVASTATGNNSCEVMETEVQLRCAAVCSLLLKI